MNTPVNIHMVNDLFLEKKIHLLTKLGSVDMTGICKSINSIYLGDDKVPVVSMELRVTSTISFNVEVPISLIRVDEE